MLSLIGDPRQLCACSRCTGKPKLAPGASDAAAISYVPSVGSGWLDLVQSFFNYFYILFFVFNRAVFIFLPLPPPLDVNTMCVCVCVYLEVLPLRLLPARNASC